MRRAITDVPYFPEELQEVYRLQVFSYIAQDNEGKNALMLAVRSGNSACFPFLLSPETAMTLNQKDKNGDTPLVFIIKSKNFELIKEFLRVTEETLDNSKCEIKLEIDDDDISNCIQNIGSRRIKSLITSFLDRVNKNASPCSKPLPLKRKNTEQANGIPEKKRKEGGDTIEERIPRLVNILEEKKGTISINGLISTRNFINDTNEKLPTRDERKDYKEVRQKLKELENKLQEVGKARLEKLLNEASVPDLTDKKKEEILGGIKKLVIEAKIEFSKDLKIPEIVKNKVKDIIPNSTVNELASCSHSLALQR